MKLIPQSEIDKAAVNYEWSKSFANSYIDFQAGVEFAESKFEALAIEFAKYILSMQITKAKSSIDLETYTPPEFNLLKGELIVNGSDLFQQFIKDRDEV